MSAAAVLHRVVHVRSFVGLCLLLCVGLDARHAGAAPIVSLSPSAAVVTVGDTFSVDVLVSGAADLYAYQMGVAFDAARFSASLVSEGGFLPAAGTTLFFPGAIDNGLGLITFNLGTLVGPIAGASGDGTLFSVLFKAKSAGSGDISPLFDVALNGDGLYDSAGLALSFDAGNSVGVVVEPKTAPEPATLSLLGLGLTAGAVSRWRRRRAVR
jgi:hypothetical protein